MIVIPNGIDTERFFPNRRLGRRVREEWKVGDEKLLIGMVGRFHPMKDHANFLRAAALLVGERDDVCFVCVGNGTASYGNELRRLGDRLGLAGRLVWAGVRKDMSAVYNAFDVMTSSSAYGEGFSNVVGEAMACGVPCVATDVGDSAWIVGETGQVVAAKDPDALANGWREILLLSEARRATLGRAARQRILKEFAPIRLAQRTEDALRRLCSVENGSYLP